MSVSRHSVIELCEQQYKYKYHLKTESLEPEPFYFIYDKNNIMVPSEISPHIFSSNHIFDFKIYLGGHALAISTHISNSFTFAKNYGYDFCYYLESDSSFDISDLHKLDQLSIQMELENKDMVIFNPESFIVKDCYYGEDGQYFYETLLFGAKINQFLDVFNPPKTIDEWLNNDMCYNLESCLYHKYKDRKDKCLIVPTFVHETLTESQINTNRFGMFVCEIIKNEKDKNLPILLINNLNGSTNTKVVINKNKNNGVAGTIDYVLGKITLTDFNPTGVNNTFKDIMIHMKPNINIIQSKLNKMLVLDTEDSTSISIKTTKTA